jgi:hypothetical protein
MLEITRFVNIPATRVAGLFNSNRKTILFFFHQRAFESKIEGILSAAAGHETNSLPAGSYQYRVLSAHADSLCTEFADRWDLDRDLLRARIPGLAKLAGLSVQPPPKNNARLAFIGMIAVPLALFLLGVMAGLVSVGFHLVGGR